MENKGIITISAFLSCLMMSCSQSGITALDNLTSTASNDGEYRKPFNLNYPMQSRFLSVNGLLPVPGPASSCLASSFRVANSIICFSPTKNTYVLTRRFPYQGSKNAQNDLKALRDNLTALQIKVAKLITEDAAGEERAANSTARDVLTSAAKISETIKSNNYFIFRWLGSASTDAGGNVGANYSARAAANRSSSGIVIVAGLQVSQLMIGRSDFKSVFCPAPRATKIATLTMSAEHLLYLTDANLGAAIEGTLKSDLKDIWSELSPETKIALNAYAQIGRAQENQGMFSAPTATTDDLPTALHPNNSKQVFYATMTDIETLVRAMGQDCRSD
ncbi:hypothetical protein JMM63_16275 [Rhodovulum sulfidophilum]|uniref:Lipoprotein n=1 Tax=Rhodovulum sulfidophilum TaxID=35806 RepID=A0ABS1RYJ4_RHOSU|nr:hypothetical protein [Rhodovulum sulfidophilum]MBL3597105.1 hypothetical protein [Rhodovulum sulfidophilum]MBL3611164.1 hypothetical protein [Rhodovulum sulfidophilum]MCE8458894.1 hypothetical protein [Rhodovulum sulfidophilum]